MNNEEKAMRRFMRENTVKRGKCLEWINDGRVGKYKLLWFRGKVEGAHRVAWMLKNGPVPRGKYVCHHCDNPACVLDAHLFVGTARQNMQDQPAKGRNVNVKKTHCPRGHAYDVKNTRINQGSRVCLTCARIRMRVAAGWSKKLAETAPPLRVHLGERRHGD